MSCKQEVAASGFRFSGDLHRIVSCASSWVDTTRSGEAKTHGSRQAHPPNFCRSGQAGNRLHLDGDMHATYSQRAQIAVGASVDLLLSLSWPYLAIDGWRFPWEARPTWTDRHTTSRYVTSGLVMAAIPNSSSGQLLPSLTLISISNADPTLKADIGLLVRTNGRHAGCDSVRSLLAMPLLEPVGVQTPCPSSPLAGGS